MVAENLQQFRLFRIVAGDHAAVAETAEVLAREKREAAVIADRTDPASLVLGTDRLTGVFDHDQIVLFRNLHDRVHIGRLAEEVHRDDRLRARRDLFRDLHRIDVVGHRVDIRKYRSRPDADDRAGRRKKGERRNDDLIAGADAFDHQRDDERIGTAGDADREIAGAIRSDLFFELLDLRAENEILRIGNLRNLLENFLLDRRVLRLQVKQRNRHIVLSLYSLTEWGMSPPAGTAAKDFF